MKRIRGVAALALGVAALAVAFWWGSTTRQRLAEPTEACIVFEAQRLAQRLPLWVEPSIGAHEYGQPPARFYVVYPPLWSAFLSLFPVESLRLIGRLLSSLAWLAALGLFVARAPAASRGRVAWLAWFAASTFVLTSSAASARPDAVAVLMAAVALERCVRTTRMDALSGALFVLAAFTKPNVLGAAPGAMLGAALVGLRSGGARGLLRHVGPGALGGGCVALGVASILQWASKGVWLQHLLASTGQPLDLSLWLRQLSLRGPMFAVPLALAWWGAWKDRGRPEAAVACSALGSSLAWCVFSLAKLGSASVYFLEPFVAALAAVAVCSPWRPRASRGNVVTVLALGVALAWTTVADVRSSLAEASRSLLRARAMQEARHFCSAPADSVVLGDEVGLELAANGRLVATPFQATHLVRAGRFPLDAWLDDVARPEVGCLVVQDDILERPSGQIDPSTDRFGPELRVTLARVFLFEREVAGLRFYRRRAAEDPSLSP